MGAYILRRLLMSVPIVIGILLLTFVLFYVAAKDPARVLGGKQKSESQLQAIRHELGLDKPKWLNVGAGKVEGGIFNSQFFDVLRFKFPDSYHYKQSIWTLFWRKAPISLAIQLPAFFIEIGLQLIIALWVANRRGGFLDQATTFLAVLTLAVPALSIYLGAQWLFCAKLQWFPPAGWASWPYTIRFMALPILLSVVVGVGYGARLYRSAVLEEISADYVRTARAKGVHEGDVLLTHVLRNVLIPVVTNTVAALPLLFTGVLILERMFDIPGFGNLLVEAVFNQDAPVVMAVVYVTSLIYCLALIATDVCYAVVDPRVSLN